MTLPGSLRRHAWWIFLAPAVASAWTRGLWAPDEPRYAQVAREIFERGDFLVMHLCGDVYPDKPPLLFWIAGLLGSLSEWSVPVMRLVSVASIAATAAFTAGLARRWWGPAEARWAPIVLLSFAMLSEIGGRLQIDPLLTAGCTGALYFVDRARGRSRSIELWIAGLLVGLAALAKGPVAFVDVGLVLVAWLWIVDRRRPEVRFAHWAPAVALALLPVLGWAVAAAVREPALARELFYGQHLDRVIESETRHPGPPWKNLLRMPLLLLPWTPPVVAGLVRAWRQRPFGRRAVGRHAGLRDVGLLRAATWFAVLFLFFSAIPPKRDLYLLPAYPAAALVAARWLTLCSSERSGAWAARVGAALLLVLGVAVASAPLLEIQGVPAASLGARILPGALAFLTGSGLLLHRIRAGRPWPAVLAGAWLVGVTATVIAIYPAADFHKSPRALATLVAELPQRPRQIPCLDVRPEGYRFYAGLPTVAALEIETALEREGREFLALVRAPAWEALPVRVRARTRPVLRRTVGSRDVLVLEAAPDDARVAVRSP